MSRLKGFPDVSSIYDSRSWLPWGCTEDSPLNKREGVQRIRNRGEVGYKSLRFILLKRGHASFKTKHEIQWSEPLLLKASCRGLWFYHSKEKQCARRRGGTHRAQPVTLILQQQLLRSFALSLGWRPGCCEVAYGLDSCEEGKQTKKGQGR